MGDWQNTSYLGEGNPRRIADAMMELFATEGMRLVARPSSREPQGFDPMQYAGALDNNLWGVAIFPGADGWSVVKTAPLELLGERAPGAARMRLLELTTHLAISAVQVNLYDSTALVLIETDAKGGYALSGYGPGSARHPDALGFHGEQLSEERVDVRFEFLPLQHLVEQSFRDGYGGPSLDNGALVQRLAESLGGDNAVWCDNITSVDLLLRHRLLLMRDGIDLYFEWPPHDRSWKAM